MASPERPDEIKVAEGLRDTAWDHLPTKTREARQLVEVTYWPVGAGVVKLTVKYDPHDTSLNVYTEETVSSTETQEEGYRAFMHYRGVELKADTGEVIMYSENADVRDEYGRIIESPEEVIETDTEPLSDEWWAEHSLREAADQPAHHLETDAFYTFNKDKLDYLHGLFDKI